MKTPDEIKKALECCSEISVCSECPYYNKLKFGGECVEIKSTDTLAYIQQLENHIGELTEKVAQLEAAQPKWISVNERMPEDCIDVLVFTRSGYTSSISIAHALKGRWFSKGIPIEPVNHWMQLPSIPEPPKEDA